MILRIPEKLKNDVEMNIFFNDLLKLFYSNVQYIGDPSVDSSWKVEIDGSDLKTYRLESGSWVLKDTISS